MSHHSSRSRRSSGHDQRTRPPTGCCASCWYEAGTAVPAPAYQMTQGTRRVVGVRCCPDHRAAWGAMLGPLAGPDTPPHNPLRRKPRGSCHRCWESGRPGMPGDAYDLRAPICQAGVRLCYPCLLEEESEGKTYRPAQRRR